MAEVWTIFSQGVVNVFTTAVNAVMQLWANAANKITSWIIKATGKGGDSRWHDGR